MQAISPAERIDIKNFDLQNEKFIDCSYLYVELGHNYFIYAAKYCSNTPKNKDDHALGREEKFENFKIKVLRNSIVSVEKRWLDRTEVWAVEIECNGFPNTTGSTGNDGNFSFE